MSVNYLLFVRILIKKKRGDLVLSEKKKKMIFFCFRIKKTIDLTWKSNLF